MRLRSLGTDPESFGSTHAREAAFAPEVWEARTARAATGNDAATLLALAGDEPVGTVSADREPDEPDVFVVVAMWVAPEVRRTGLGRRLLHEIERWVESVGGAEIRLSVTNRADAARRLYESAGYEPDGRSTPSPHTAGLVEIGLRRRLS